MTKFFEMKSCCSFGRIAGAEPQKELGLLGASLLISLHPVRTMPRIEIKASAQWRLAVAVSDRRRRRATGVGMLPVPVPPSSPLPASPPAAWMGMKYTRLVSPIEAAAAWAIPFSQVVVVVVVAPPFHSVSLLERLPYDLNHM